jgi:hypothetical protein
VAALSVVVCGLALLVGAALTSSTPAGATGTITVTRTPLSSDTNCVPTALGRLGWTYTTESTPSLFRLTVTNPSNLCDPVDAVAAIYALPGNGGAWPQQLVTTEPFSIQAASSISITFTKDCDPVQFDVLTGDTPKTIDVPPQGPLHGPLLFPFDTKTAEQFVPDSENCRPTTKPTPPPTQATLPPTQPTVTQPSQVAAVTTIQGGGTTTAPAQPAAVQAATQTQPSAAGTSLALTGAPSASMAALGSLLLLAGLFLLVLSRRGRRSWA